MFNYIKAEFKRNKHTNIIPLSLLKIIFLGVIPGFYLSARKLTSMDALVNYISIICILIPVGASLLVFMSIKEEENQDNFNRLLKDNSRNKIIISKLCYWFIIEASIIFGIFLSLVIILGIGEFDIGLTIILVYASLNLILQSFFYFILSLAINMKYSSTASLSIGGIGFLLTAIIGTTSIGDKFYDFVPWSYGVQSTGRLMYLVSGKLSQLNSKQITILLSDFKRLSIEGMTTNIILIVALVIWFNRWDGRSDSD